MLYVIPAVLIVGAALIGCRPEERRIAVIIGAGATIAFFPCLAIALSSDRTIARGFVYALIVVAAVQWAMVVGRRRGEPGDGGGGEASEPTAPSPIDWPDFERRFWDEVRRTPRRPPPAGSPGRDRAPV